MKKVIVYLVLMLVTKNGYSTEQEKILSLTCDDFIWSDVVLLVEPYVDESTQTAIVMQGINSRYKLSVIASMALCATKPDAVQKILTYLVNADC